MARKLKLSELQSIYQNLTGEDVEVVADDSTESEHDADAIINLVDVKRSPIIEQKLRTTLEADVNKHVNGKNMSALRKVLAEMTGVPAADIEGKDAKEATKIAFAHYGKSLGGDKEGLEQQLREVMEKHSQELEKERKGRTEDKANFDKQIARYGINNILAEMYANAKGISEKANKQILQADFLNHLERNYTLKLSEDGKTLKLYEIADPTKVALNKAGTNELVLADEMKQYHVDRLQWHEDNRDVNPAKVVPHAPNQPIRNGQQVFTTEQQGHNNLAAWVGAEHAKVGV